MRSKESNSKFPTLILLLGLLVLPRGVLSYCHEMELVNQWPGLSERITDLTFSPSMITDPFLSFTIRLAAASSKPVAIE